MSHPPATTPPTRRRSPFVWIAIVLVAIAIWFGVMLFGNRAAQDDDRAAPAGATTPVGGGAAASP